MEPHAEEFKHTRGSANAATRTVAIVVYRGVEALDVTGPSAVFSGANRVVRMQDQRVPPPYRIVLLGPSTRALQTSDGLTLVPHRAFARERAALDTLLVAGSPDVERYGLEAGLIKAVRRLARRARRVGSVCTGSFILAAAGLLDGRRATTHWAYAARLAEKFPQVAVDAEPIYLRDGHLYSSAGVSAGMDLALALVEEDLGRTVALAVARGLVLYLRRPGGQSQFSSLLQAQTTARSALGELQLWVATHLDADLSVGALAQRVAMSPRNFARVFTRQTGVTPGKFVEQLRLEAARRQLEESDVAVKVVAAQCGFGSSEALRAAFLRSVRVSPNAYRERFRGAVASA